LSHKLIGVRSTLLVSYPENTINFLVSNKLKEMAERLKGFYAEEKKEVK